MTYLPHIQPLDPPRDMEVITTHVGADFDALASMLAAARIYPGAMLVFPGSQERNLRNFFVESTCYLYNFVKMKNVPTDRVGRLILVDTRQADRLGPLAFLAQDPRVEVHAYDHHPDSADDVRVDFQMVEPVGATVTVLSRILREMNLVLAEDEATLLALGIYEDTGSFAFSSTTPHDLEAAAWLLRQGANLNQISSMVTHELTSLELDILHEMVGSKEILNISGVEVVITQVSRTTYVPEFAVLMRKFMDMEDMDTVFALARMEGRVYLVARSRLAEVDAGAIAKTMGGGGHPSAASATLRDMTLVEARARLETVLRSHVNPSRMAGDLMTSPPVTVEGETTLAQAHDVLGRYGISVLPVMEKGQVKGAITRQIVEKALSHGLANLAVSEYMDHRVEPLGPKETLARVEELLVGRRQRLVPVLQDGVLVGVITRTDLLHSLIEHPPLPESGGGESPGSHPFRKKIIAGLMNERLPRNVVSLLKEMGRIAQELGYVAFLVGGSVRDLFLRRENLDLDLVVEGEGVELAKAFGRRHPEVRVRSHKKFGTAKIIWEDGSLVMDIATARLDHYASIAALPTVERSSLRQDLYRRDFTINTLAVSLIPDSFGRLLDFFDAMRDIKEKRIRVLHNLSFVEDPTRVLRAVRFEQRFGFRIGKFTEGLIKNALQIEAFKRLTGHRLLVELKHILEEEKAMDCLLRLEELGLMGEFHAKLRLGPLQVELLEQVDEALAWYRLSFLDRPLRQWLVYLLALSSPLKGAEAVQLCQRLAMAPRLINEFTSMRHLALQAVHQMQRARLSPSQCFRVLAPLKVEYQLFIMARAQREWVKRAVSHYLTQQRKERTLLRGQDLKAMGFESGPVFKQILDRVMDARLDGLVRTRQEEEDLVRTEFNGLKEQSA